MNPEAMRPYALALMDYYRGNLSAALTIVRDDGWITQLPIDTFFRQAQKLELEKKALDLCRGDILDVGAGTGLHSLFLQEMGLRVTAIDVSAEAVQIMKERGVTNAQQADIMLFNEGYFDTIIMMGHGIGVVENIAGLDQFLKNMHELLKPNGQILLTSAELRVTNEPIHLAYHRRNLDAGRYYGEIRMQFKYRDFIGPLFGWLHVDAETLGIHALKVGWQCEVISQQQDGNYLARLSKKRQE